jgi:hypothetical protein
VVNLKWKQSGEFVKFANVYEERTFDPSLAEASGLAPEQHSQPDYDYFHAVYKILGN